MTAPIRVTDHAVVRYLERARGFDIEAIRKHIAEVCVAAHVGATCVRSEGVRFGITHNETGPVVTTVTPNGPLPNKTARDNLLNHRSVPAPFIQVGDAVAGALRNIEAKRR